MGVLISCAIPAASSPIDSSFCAWASWLCMSLRPVILAPKRLFEKSGNERFDQCRATSEDATITLSLLKSIMPIFMWIPFQAAMETFQTASEGGGVLGVAR